MFKFIIIAALIGAGGYFLFQKIESDKLNNTNSIASMQVDENSSAASRIIKKITNEN